MSYKVIEHNPDSEVEDNNEQDSGSNFVDYYYVDGKIIEGDCPRCGSPVLNLFRYCAECAEPLFEEEEDEGREVEP